MEFLLVGAGAALGAISRWQISNLMKDYFVSFHFGTLFVNIVGSFIIGIALGLNLNDNQKLIFITGFLGSFTTFSTFSAEVLAKFNEKSFILALQTISLHLILSLLAVTLGAFLAKILTNC